MCPKNQLQPLSLPLKRSDLFLQLSLHMFQMIRLLKEKAQAQDMRLMAEHGL